MYMTKKGYVEAHFVPPKALVYELNGPRIGKILPFINLRGNDLLHYELFPARYGAEEKFWYFRARLTRGEPL